MLKGFKEFMARSDLITIAVGLLMALAAFYLLQATPFVLNSFTIDTSEFRYGAVIDAAITFVLAATAGYLLLLAPYRRYQGRQGIAAKTRTCPECTSSISALAKRCPYCTAVVQADPPTSP